MQDTVRSWRLQQMDTILTFSRQISPNIELVLASVFSQTLLSRVRTNEHINTLHTLKKILWIQGHRQKLNLKSFHTIWHDWAFFYHTERHSFSITFSSLQSLFCPRWIPHNTSNAYSLFLISSTHIHYVEESLRMFSETENPFPKHGFFIKSAAAAQLTWLWAVKTTTISLIEVQCSLVGFHC